MQTKFQISGYDFIKLVFALTVAVFLYVAFRPSTQPQRVTDLTLPAYPQADFEWEYDPATRELLNPQGIQLYRLDADNVTWRPIIPATLSLQLPGEYRVVHNSQRTWQILDTVGAIISSWDAENFRWVMGTIPTATQPRSTPTLQITATPTLAAPTPTSIPATATLAVPVPLPTTSACNPNVPTYLTAGQPARVLINLNMHTTPEMIENVFDANPAGVIVDVLQGPVCVPYLTGAYWWWEIRNAEGVTGWSVEATINGAVYFLGPLE